MAENIAEKMSEAMREVSVAEFFEKNRHLLGYENPTKALITVVKELLDNSLDAANEAGILPTIKINVASISEDKFKVTVKDNGPGIRDDKVPYAFGKLLYGSKFYRLLQSRGIQGLGGHGAVLYSQLTTGRPAKITTSIGKKTHYFEMVINVSENEPQILRHEVMENPEGWHGLKIELELEGRYVEGKQSMLEYIKQTHMANPYSQITFDGPNGKSVYKRLLSKMPKQPKEIKPHPYGVEIGVFRRMLAATKAKTVTTFLTEDFSRVGKRSALQILKAAKVEPKKKPLEVSHEESERIHKAIQNVKLIAPPTDCLSPLGEKLLEEGLKKDTGAEYVVAVTRPPSVYRGNPFLVEVAMGYGGTLAADQTAQLFRFANKVPLLYHQSDCVTTEAVKEVDFRRYGFSQPSSSLPAGPLAILVHFASVWVPFTSEGKQAIANYPEILREIKLALQDAGRKLGSYVNQKVRQTQMQLRKELFEKYLPELAESLAKLTGKSKDKIIRDLEKIMTEKDVRGEEKSEAAEKDVEGVKKSEEGEIDEDVGREEKSEEAGQ
ncbi:MAG: DNA topoisomerase VI subunit B [Candidatus Hadarchaeota archaeon]